jgi:aspartyl-tRNA synthetase
MKWRQRSYCGEITHSHAGETLLLMGWVDAIRDHGHLLFVHLRDTSGIVQVVFDPDIGWESYDEAGKLREEYIIQVAGKVAIRERGTENPHLKTGNVEVFAEEMTILSGSKSLPFQLSEKAMLFGEEIAKNPANVDEELRLQYRYLDLRRPSMQRLLSKRYDVIKCIRDYLHELNFIEVETPLLTQSTPEGARDFLVPSRLHEGRFYALPQSPQLFKQLLMMSGVDRYFQIARCFRDEDLRPNRQPEFTQLDLENICH